MFTVAGTPFTGLLELFAAVPLAVMGAICAAECTQAYRRRPGRSGRR